MAPDISRRYVMISRQVFCPVGGGDDAESGGARPVHHLGGQGRLVAIGQRINYAGVARFLREQRPRQHIGLDVDHDDVLAGRNRRARMFDADGGIAGGFHDHFDIARCRFGAIRGECGRSYPRGVPADGAAGLARAIRIEGDDHGHLEPRRMRHLRKKHRAELAGADQRDADGFSGRAADVEQMREVHGGGDPIGFLISRHSGTRVFAWTRNDEMISARFRVRAFSAPRNDGANSYSAAWRWLRASRSSASSSTVWIGAKSRWAMYSGRVGVRM